MVEDRRAPGPEALEDLQAIIDGGGAGVPRAFLRQSRRWAEMKCYDEARTAYLMAVGLDAALADEPYFRQLRSEDERRLKEKAADKWADYGQRIDTDLPPDPAGLRALQSEVIASPQDDGARLRLAVHLLWRGKEADLAQALRGGREDAPAMELLRRLVAGEQDESRLLEQADKLRKKDPFDPQPHRLQALLYRRLNDVRQAEAAYRASTSASKHRDLAIEAWILGNRVRDGRYSDYSGLPVWHDRWARAVVAAAGRRSKGKAAGRRPIRKGGVEPRPLPGPELQERLILALLSSTSIGCLLAEFYGVLSMRAAAVYLLMPAMVLLAVRAFNERLRQDVSLARIVSIGAAAGLVAALAYDAFRLPFVLAAADAIGPAWLRLPLFKVFPRFGALILGEPYAAGQTAAEFSLLAHLVGWAYHFSNGATFGVIYLAIIGDAVRRHWGWAALYGLGLELAMLATPYAAYFGIHPTGRFVAVTLAAHLVFGIVLGLCCRAWSR